MSICIEFYILSTCFKKQLKLWLNVPEIAIAPLSKHVETKDVLILAA